MNKIQVGKIVSTHGIKGEIKVLSYTNIDNLFKTVKEIWIDEQVYTIETVKQVKNCPILKLTSIDTPETARSFVGRFIYVEDDTLPSLDDGNYYVKDILGAMVYDEEEHFLGKLTNVFFTGANDVYEITTPENKTALIPAVKEFVLNVNITEKTIKLHLIEGMIE